MKILGISAYYHDSAAALVVDGQVVAAAQEERFTRKKHDSEFPVNAINFCLSSQSLDLSNLDYIAFYDKPFLKFERLLETYLAFAPRGFQSFAKAMPVWLKDKLFQKREILNALKQLNPTVDFEKKLLFSEHHLSHAASAFYPSPFEKALVLTMDGVGEWATTSVCIGEGNSLRPLKEIHFPHSLGLLYSAFTYYTGFKVNSGEYKLMGLAPYGKPLFAKKIFENLIDVKEDGSFRLNMKYFDYCTGLKMVNSSFEELFGVKVRTPEQPLEQVHMDLAASIQFVLEEVVLRLVQSLRAETGINNICLAGGVALNCVANGKILAEKDPPTLWVQPAAGDAGGALGAALAAYHLELNKERSLAIGQADGMRGSYLGPAYSAEEIKRDLNLAGAVYHSYDENVALERISDALVEGKAIGWFQGAMEFGPRALGARSIIADPRSAVMQKNLNLKIKYRESFRPFAPAVLAEHVNEWFDYQGTSPYMLVVAPVRENRRLAVALEDKCKFGIDLLNVPKSVIPAVTHVDYSARLQTVHKETNEKFHKLIELFFKKTGCPMVVNTSFNVRGEPIVNTPSDAFKCFMGTEMDVLVIENVVLYKNDQNHHLATNYKNLFELD